VHAEFTKHVIQVLLDRAFGNAEGIGDLAVAHALHQQLDGLSLAIGERRLRLARCRRGRLAPVALPSVRFAAIAEAPVSTFAALAKRPLQFRLRLIVRNWFLALTQTFNCPLSHPSKQDTSELRERFPR